MSTAKTSTGKSTKVLPGVEFRVQQTARVEVEVQDRTFNDDPEGPPPPIPQSKSGPSRPAPDGVRKPDCRGQDSPVSIREER
ncbi:MAG: hypothetical protein M1815_003912 [Lichina confinis]|nr:MAG: hypothetical protein M1815_003912 [Lichina confinis]